MVRSKLRCCAELTRPRSTTSPRSNPALPAQLLRTSLWTGFRVRLTRTGFDLTTLGFTLATPGSSPGFAFGSANCFAKIDRILRPAQDRNTAPRPIRLHQPNRPSTCSEQPRGHRGQAVEMHRQGLLVELGRLDGPAGAGRGGGRGRRAAMARAHMAQGRICAPHCPVPFPLPRGERGRDVGVVVGHRRRRSSGGGRSARPRGEARRAGTRCGRRFR